MGHRWVIKSVDMLASSALFAFLVYFGIVHNLFNWGPDWWYSLTTLLVWLPGPAYNGDKDRD